MSESAGDALTRGAARLHAAGIDSARLDARVLLSHALGLSQAGVFPTDARPDDVQLFGRLIERRAAREPLAYIIGRKEFWSLDFNVGPGVLVPRPETETLMEAALRSFPNAGAPLQVLDIGTGSGCLLISFLKERPKATGIGIDISETALTYARRNAGLHGVAARCCLGLAASLGRDALPYPAGGFDVVLANPPYLKDEEFSASAPEIRDYEPESAFVAGSDGLAAFRTFLSLTVKVLSPAGMAFFEIGAGQAQEVTEIVSGVGLEVRLAVPDLSGIPRCLAIGHAVEGSP